MEATGATADMVLATAGATTESVRLMPSLRLLPSPITATEDMEAIRATADMVLATAGATTASVRLRPSPTTAMEGTEATVVAMEVMVDTVATEATEAMEVTVMATASNMFPGSS